MAKFTALLVGLTSVNPKKYNGWDGTSGCWGCGRDVQLMDRILRAQNFDTECVLNSKATGNKILAMLRAAAVASGPGDLFVFYFSGHGGSKLDENGDEVDGFDETLVLWDRELLDDDLGKVWPLFNPGSRIVMISDSCNSGSVLKVMPNGLKVEDVPLTKPLRLEPPAAMRAQMIHMGGCRDRATSNGTPLGGSFTLALGEVWNDGAFDGCYMDLVVEVRSKVRGTQDPQYVEHGPVTDEFRRQVPFTNVASGEPVVPAPVDRAAGSIIAPAGSPMLRLTIEVYANGMVCTNDEPERSGHGRSASSGQGRSGHTRSDQGPYRGSKGGHGR